MSYQVIHQRECLYLKVRSFRHLTYHWLMTTISVVAEELVNLCQWSSGNVRITRCCIKRENFFLLAIKIQLICENTLMCLKRLYIRGTKVVDKALSSEHWRDFDCGKKKCLFVPQREDLNPP